jgi:hypothetical protein
MEFVFSPASEQQPLRPRVVRFHQPKTHIGEFDEN